ncbi:MAG: aminotransferase class V-fold PLP-dependent enzyme [Bacteroidota bacterium]
MVKLPIYLDNHATTQADPQVVQAMIPYFTEHFGNAASRQHRFGWIAEEAVENGRKTIARQINAEAKEIIFTSGATESNNLALKGMAEAYQKKGNHLITSRTEHRSVLDVCSVLERTGYRVTYLNVDEYGTVNPQNVRDAMTDQTVLVSLMMANNEIGTLAPIKEIGQICLERGILLHTDATQSMGKTPIDVKSLNIHCMSISAHKIYGPKGIGALYVRNKNPRVRIVQQMDGGGHEGGMRSGTLNVPAIVGFAKAVELAAHQNAKESIRVAALRDRLEEQLLAIDGARCNGHRTKRLYNNLNIIFPYVHADDLMVALKDDVAVSSGSACSSAEFNAQKVSHVLSAIGLDDELARCTIRIGLGRFTTEEEVDFAGRKIVEAVHRLRESSPQFQMHAMAKSPEAITFPHL